eukprot:gene42459-13013_t
MVIPAAACATAPLPPPLVAGRLVVTRRNVHRILLASLLAAAKWTQDCCYRMKDYARIGGVTCDELGRLEMAFLTDKDRCSRKGSRFNLFVNRSEIDGYSAQLPELEGREP